MHNCKHMLQALELGLPYFNFLCLIIICMYFEGVEYVHPFI